MKRVLFVCTHNAGRSPMAAAFFNELAPADLHAESAGSAPATHVQPLVVDVMREVGIDLSTHRPRRLTVEMQFHVDWAVTMGCGDVCPYVPTRVEEWEVPDPAGEPIDRVREIRDVIAEHVRRFVSEHVDTIRTDRTAHAMRLAEILPPLIDEFADRHPADEIRSCADAILDQYTGVAVRSYVNTLALRRARECLRAEVCDPAAV